MKLLKKLGYGLIKIKKKEYTFDDLLKDKISLNPLIIDVGGNMGQSVERFLKIFDKPIIHVFEPEKKAFNYMHNKFKNNKNIILNNFALGDNNEIKEFNVTAKTDNSSFNKINIGTSWLKVRSQQNNTTEEGYVTSVENVVIKKLDDYISANNINNIDLLKIDTQGYEDKVLAGGLNTIKKNKVKAIIAEIIFDNCYSKYLTFSDIEKIILPYGFRMVALDLKNKNIFSNLNFFANVYYLNQNYYSI